MSDFRKARTFSQDLLNPFRWGWVFLERTRILSGIQFTTHFINVFVVETKRFVGGFVNVILTRQTCGQHWSRAAESKRRALGNYVSERICYMFLISICRVDGDSVHKRLENRTAMATSGKKTCFDAGKIGFCHCSAVLQTQVSKLCTDLDLSLLYILILGTYSKFARKNNFLALCVCFRSLARALAAGFPRQDHVYSTTDVSFRFHKKRIDEIRCKLDSTENPLLFGKYPTPP